MKIQWKQEGKNMALLLVGALIYGIGTHAFVEPAHIAPGGAMGIALMVNHFADLPIGLLTLAINIPAGAGLVFSEPSFCGIYSLCYRGLLLYIGLYGGTRLPSVYRRPNSVQPLWRHSLRRGHGADLYGGNDHRGQ